MLNITPPAKSTFTKITLIKFAITKNTRTYFTLAKIKLAKLTLTKTAHVKFAIAKITCTKFTLAKIRFTTFAISKFPGKCLKLLIIKVFQNC
jgi:hypothetical protein